MRFIVESTNGSDPSELLEAEGRRAEQLRSKGVFLEVWPKEDGSGAVVLASSASEASLRALLDTMPTIAVGIASYRVIALADRPSES